MIDKTCVWPQHPPERSVRAMDPVYEEGFFESIADKYSYGPFYFAHTLPASETWRLTVHQRGLSDSLAALFSADATYTITEEADHTLFHINEGSYPKADFLFFLARETKMFIIAIDPVPPETAAYKQQAKSVSFVRSGQGRLCTVNGEACSLIDLMDTLAKTLGLIVCMNNRDVGAIS